MDPGVVMAAIRAAKLHLPDTVDRALAQVLRKALAPDVGHRYRTAGEFAGALFTWALDTGQVHTRQDVQDWLQGILGLIL
jgi:serine/threonine-protein kinase